MNQSQFARTTLFIATSMAAASAQAVTLYDAGNLSFETKAQSMWGSGTAFRKSESVFVGAAWANQNAKLGTIVGDANTLITPATPEKLLTEAVPAKTIPGVPAKQLTPYVAPKLITPSFRARYTPAIPATYLFGEKVTDRVAPKLISRAIPATYTPAIPATYSPAIAPITIAAIPAGIFPAVPAIYADTRTGATIGVNSTGKIGLDFSYTIDSGSVDAMARFGATAQLPDTVRAGELFSIQTGSALKLGTLATQSPRVAASISQVVQMQGKIDVQICGLTLGCKTASADLPRVNVNQPLLSIDANSLKVLDRLMPNGKPFAEVPIANQSLTLVAGLPAPSGFQLAAGPLTIASSWPKEEPRATTDVASLTVFAPDIATTGRAEGAPVTSTGRSDLLSLQIDIDGVAAAVNAIRPAGINFELVKSGEFTMDASVNLLDADAGPVLGVTQDFSFESRLMTTIRFSRAVRIGGQSGLHESWTGEWKDLPQFAITGTTTFLPTFWLDAVLTNQFGLDLGVVGTLDVLKVGATAKAAGVDLLKINEVSLNDLLGLDNELFETDKLQFSVFDDSFDLGGFNTIEGDPFTFVMNGSQFSALLGAAPTAPVPESSTYAMLLAGLGLLGATMRRRGQAQRNTPAAPQG